MGWLVRISVSDLDDAADREVQQALVQLHDRHPDWIDGMKVLSRVETRQELRQKGLSLDAFRGIDVGMVAMPPDLVAVPQRYAIKLGKALHYHHTSRAVPVDGVVKAFIYPNIEFMSQQFPLDQFHLLQGRAVVSRSGKRLEDQFNYRYGITPDASASAFLVQFGESMAIAIFVFEDEGTYLARQAALGLPSRS